MQVETQKTRLNSNPEHLHVLISHSPIGRAHPNVWGESRELIPIFIIFHIFAEHSLLFLHGKSLVSVCLLFTQDKSLIYFIRTINSARGDGERKGSVSRLH